jgi:hypothetical protein
MCIFSISSRAFPRVHTIVSRSIAIREPHDSGITRCLLSDSLLLLTEATITSSALLSRPSLPTVDGKSVYKGSVTVICQSSTHPLLYIQFDKQSNTIDMVAPRSCPGLNVEILVDDQPLQEYDDMEDDLGDPNTIIKYIEARSNAYFAVRVEMNYDFPFPAGDLEIRTTVDERHTDSRLIRADKLYDLSGTIINGCVTRIGDRTDGLYKFRFVALNSGESQRLRNYDLGED